MHLSVVLVSNVEKQKNEKRVETNQIRNCFLAIGSASYLKGAIKSLLTCAKMLLGIAFFFIVDWHSHSTSNV